jgi:hypothetical protein
VTKEHQSYISSNIIIIVIDVIVIIIIITHTGIGPGLLIMGIIKHNDLNLFRGLSGILY